RRATASSRSLARNAPRSTPSSPATTAAGSRSTRSCRWARRASAASVSTHGSAAHRHEPEPARQALGTVGWHGAAARAGPDDAPERTTMKPLPVCCWASLAALLMLAAVPATAADVQDLFAIDLPDAPGKEGRMIEVSYPPGAQDMVHRHDAHAFVYVLEGTIVMQLK